MKGAELDRKLLHDLVEFTGMKPAKIAREAGLAVTTINRPYSGAVSTRLSQPTLDKLRQRFPYFEGWADYLGAVPNTTEAMPDGYSVEEIAWMDLLRGLHPADLKMVLQFARRLRGDGPVIPPTAHEGTTDYWAERKDRLGR